MKTILYRKAKPFEKKYQDIWGRRVVAEVFDNDESISIALNGEFVKTPLDLDKTTIESLMVEAKAEQEAKTVKQADTENVTLEQVDTNGDGYPSLKELRAAAIEKGIEGAETKKRKTLIKELGL